MKIIDSHIHAAFDNISFCEAAKKQGIDFSFKGLKKEQTELGIEKSVIITFEKAGNRAIMEEQKIQQYLELGFPVVLGLNPKHITKATVKEVKEQFIENPGIKGVKIYPGYFYHYPFENMYLPFYELCGMLNKTVVLHFGDTMHSDAKVKYSMPIHLDEVAVDFPNTRFVMAHLGNPWLIDAAEVCYKNPNVYADLSGINVGDTIGSLVDYDRIRVAFRYINDPKKLMFGTDWPLAGMKSTIDLMKRLIPEENHCQFFYENAKDVFRL